MKIEREIKRPDAGRRLDRYVHSVLGAVPASLVQRLLRKGEVKVNGRRGKAGDLLRTGDTVVIFHRPRAEDQKPRQARRTVSPYDGPTISILTQTDSFVLANKPAGLSCQSSKTQEPSLQSWAEDHLKEQIAGGNVRPTMPHRLDRGTSGVVAIALTSQAVREFQAALSRGDIEKRYWVAVWGKPLEQRFDLEARLLRLPQADRDQPKVVASDAAESQSARTRLRVLSQSASATLLEAIPVTGRTHQIRAHLLGAGFPVVGDPRYGRPDADQRHGVTDVLTRPLLHAHTLAFPSGNTTLRAKAPFPADALAALARLDLDLPG